MKESSREFTIPILCLPEFLEKNPANLVYCIIYIIACVMVAAVAIFYYFKRKINQNGHTDIEQASLRELHNKDVIHGLLSGGPNT